MTSTDDPQQKPRGHGSLAGQTARGFGWLSAQSLGNRVVQLGSTILLGWLLAPEHFKLVALTYTITGVISIVRDAGLRDVLVHRHASFRIWAGPSFWLSVVSGFVAAALTMAAIPLALALYKEPQLTGMLTIAAVASIIMPLGAVPDAHLRNRLGFRLMAKIGFVTFLARSLLTVLFAALGFGAYSFMLPLPIVAVGRVSYLWSVERPRMRWRPHFRRWKYLLPDNLTLIGARIVDTIGFMADRTVLGVVYFDSNAAGVYQFSSSFASQTIRTFVHNLSNVLFPALSKLQGNRERLRKGFMRAARGLAVICVPLCILQGAIAEFVIPMVFPDKWLPAIPVIQLLSIGAAMRVIRTPSRSMLLAQGLFGTRLILATVYATMLFTSVLIAVQFGEAVSVAIAVTIVLSIFGPFQTYFAIRPVGGGVRDVARIFVPPLAVSGLAVGSAYLVGRTVPDIPFRNLVVTGIIVVWSGAVYVPLVRFLVPDVWHDVAGRAKGLLDRKRKPKSGTAAETTSESADVES